MQIGDVVVLKSGGPKMTIAVFGMSPISDEDDTKVKMVGCSYFINGKYKIERFPLTSLKLTEEGE